MKVDLYTRGVLTVIAVLLAMHLVRDLILNPVASVNAQNVTDVRIVGIGGVGGGLGPALPVLPGSLDNVGTPERPSYVFRPAASLGRILVNPDQRR